MIEDLNYIATINYMIRHTINYYGIELLRELNYYGPTCLVFLIAHERKLLWTNLLGYLSPRQRQQKKKKKERHVTFSFSSINLQLFEFSQIRGVQSRISEIRLKSCLSKH